MALEVAGATARSVPASIDTTPGGKRIFHVFGALAECERDSIRERTLAGLVETRARGRKGGRKRLLDATRKVAMAQALHADQRHSIREICATLQISRATLYRSIRINTESVKSPDCPDV